MRVRSYKFRHSRPVWYLPIYGFTEIHCKEYRIIYEIVSTTVYVYCIIHMKRDVLDLLKERLLA